MPEQIGEQDPGVVSQVQDGGPPLGAQAGAEAPPAPGAADPAQQRAEPKNVVVPTSSMKRIKEEQYNAGKQAALEELAKSAGFESNTDLVQALAKLKSAPQAPAPVPQRQQAASVAEDPAGEDPAADLANAKNVRREEGKFQRQLEKVLNERNRFASSATQWQQKAKEAQAEAEATKAEMHIRTIAAQAGVQDIDYSVMLFGREVERLTPEEAEKFDEKAFFEGLRKTKPLLFGEVVQPANTGTGAGGAPRAPSPGQVRQQNGANGAADVKKMTPQQYQEHLVKSGINPHQH